MRYRQGFTQSVSEETLCTWILSQSTTRLLLTLPSLLKKLTHQLPGINTKMTKEAIVDTEVIVTYTGLSGNVNQPKDTPFCWFVSVCASLASLIVVGILFSYGIFFPLILDEFEEAKSTTAFVGSLSLSCSGIFSPVSAKLINRFGCQLVMISGGLICAVGLFASSFSPNIFILFLFYGICYGFGGCLVYIAVLQIIPLYFERHRSLATGLASAGPGIGLLLMSPIIQTILDYFDWRRTFMILAALNLAPCMLGCSIKRKSVDLKIQPNATQKKKTSNRCSRCIPVFDMTAMKDPTFIFLCASFVVTCLAVAIPTVHLAKYAKDLGISGHISSWMYFTIGLTSAVSRIFTGKLGDTGWISLLHIYQFGVIIFAVINFLLPLATSFSHLIVYCSVFGIVEGLIVSPMQCTMLLSFSTEAFGWYMCFISISYLIGPVLAGLIADLSGSYHPAFITSGALFITSFFPLFLLKCVRKSDRKEMEMSSDIEEEYEIYEKETVL